MATQAINQQITAAVPLERGEGWQKVRGFFSPITEVLGMCFASHATISQLSNDYRANLSVKERTAMDAAFMGLD